MFCRVCRTLIHYSFAMCWWHCRCRVWATDERIKRQVN